MKPVRCLAVGRLKATHWIRAAEHYAGLISRFVRLELEAVKDGPARLPASQKIKAEGKALLARLGQKDLALGLDERGRTLSSKGFAAALRSWLEDPTRRPCFILGGAYGLSEEVRLRCQGLISLGPMTLPHEMARVVLLEQLYRAMTILRGTSYHH